jgi:phospholipase C
MIAMVACVPGAPIPTSTPLPSATATVTLAPTLTPTITLTPTPIPTATPTPLIPNFDHIVIIIFENKEFGSVIGNSDMPVFNRYAEDYTLLSQFYAVTHPSLPNYIAMIGGDTFGIETNCKDCFVSAPSLPDLIEESGRTWKTYQEDMPEPCFTGDNVDYAQKHNPFIYFDAIRLDPVRCGRSVVPLTDLQTDIQNGALPNFIFITPNLCNSAHDCSLEVTDRWLENTLAPLVPALEADSPNYLIVLTWDEGQGDHSCCGLPEKAGGRIAVVLISPLVRKNFEDLSQYTHYSLLKTIANAWSLPYLGHAAEENHRLILAPFQ